MVECFAHSLHVHVHRRYIRYKIIPWHSTTKPNESGKNIAQRVMTSIVAICTYIYYKCFGSLDHSGAPKVHGAYAAYPTYPPSLGPTFLQITNNFNRFPLLDSAICSLFSIVSPILSFPTFG